VKHELVYIWPQTRISAEHGAKQVVKLNKSLIRAGHLIIAIYYSQLGRVLERMFVVAEQKEATPK
jgi:hypothetical protein